MNKIVEAINAVKSSLKYHWSLFKNNIEIYMEVESDFLKIKWTDKYEGLTLSKFMPCKRFSEVFRDLITIVKAYMPEQKEEIDEFLKEMDKSVKLDLVSYNVLMSLLENKYEIDYQNGVLTISITKGEYYFILTINEEFLRDLKEVIDDPELLIDCIPSFIKEWIEEEKEKKTKKEEKIRDQIRNLAEEYKEFLDEFSKKQDLNSKEYWEVAFKNPDKTSYPSKIELTPYDSDYEIRRANEFLAEWKSNLPKIKEQEERETLIDTIKKEFPDNIRYEGFDTYRIKIDDKIKRIDKEESSVETIKGILEELKKKEKEDKNIK